MTQFHVLVDLIARSSNDELLG